jgi:DNA-binding LytR/AlgR family response regulator
VTVQPHDRRLFRRQIELTAELRRATRPPVSEARLLELLTNQFFRRKSRVASLLTGIVDADEVAWLEGNGSGVTVYGNQLRMIYQPMAAILDDFRRRGAKFALVSDTVAINLARVEAVNVEREGGGTVMLDDGFRIGVDRERLRLLLRKLRHARSGGSTRLGTASRETGHDERRTCDHMVEP